MSASGCEGRELLIQADLDGELDVAASAALAAHVATCPRCAALQAELATLSMRLREEVPREAAPEALRRALMARAAPIPVQVPMPVPVRIPYRARPLAAFAIGAALAACLAFVLLPRSDTEADDLLAGHLRALQPGHLTDVISTDQHTVKPWFNGRLDYSPPVKDLAASGFPLVGGRLDYIGHRPVAALVYRHDLHIIDLFVWPGHEAGSGPDRLRDGYNVVAWTEGGMVFRAVSDLNPAELADFARLWQAAP